MREGAGLNDPWYEQYFRWIGNALHGDFGHSFIFKLPVSTLILWSGGEYDCIGRCVSYNHVFNRHSFRFNSAVTKIHGLTKWWLSTTSSVLPYHYSSLP